MNRQSLLISDNISTILAILSEQKANTPIRELNTGYDLFKDPRFKEYRHLTLGQFLSRIQAYDSIPRPIARLADLVIALAFEGDEVPGKVYPGRADQAVAPVFAKKVELPADKSKSFFEQADEVCCTLLSAMESSNDKNKTYAMCIRMMMDSDESDMRLASRFGFTYERIRQIRSDFLMSVSDGLLNRNLASQYSVSRKFTAKVREVAHCAENLTLRNAQARYGTIDLRHLRFILHGLNLEMFDINDVTFIAKYGHRRQLRHAVRELKMMLKKQFAFLPFSSIAEDMEPHVAGFIHTFLSTFPHTYRFTPDGQSVRMIGPGLEKSIRLARIIYDAEGWIDKEDVYRIYREEYGETPPLFNSCVLRGLGFSPMNKRSKWRYGAMIPSVQSLIRTIITPEHPLATFREIKKALRENDMEYSDSTLRTYITEVATPDNSDSNLFCHKDCCHLFPDHVWRRKKKI